MPHLIGQAEIQVYIYIDLFIFKVIGHCSHFVGPISDSELNFEVFFLGVFYYPLVNPWRGFAVGLILLLSLY